MSLKSIVASVTGLFSRVSTTEQTVINGYGTIKNAVGVVEGMAIKALTVADTDPAYKAALTAASAEVETEVSAAETAMGTAAKDIGTAAEAVLKLTIAVANLVVVSGPGVEVAARDALDATSVAGALAAVATHG